MRYKIHGTELDFDEWRALAETAPDEFERRRREVLEAFIAETARDNQAHLRRLQWRIDMQRRYHWRNPLVATRRMFDMMMESVYGEGGLLIALQRVSEGDADPPRAASARTPATVLSLKARTKRR